MTDDRDDIRLGPTGISALERVPDARLRLPIPEAARSGPKPTNTFTIWRAIGTSTALVRAEPPYREARPRLHPKAHRVPGWSTGEEIDKAAAFVERYRDAWCRDGRTGREGTLTAVNGRSAYLRAMNGVEFTYRLPTLVIVRLPPPRLYRRVRYVGKEDPARRPPGDIMETWAVTNGTLATVQPRTGPAWFALLADLERDLPTGPVADWDDPPFIPHHAEDEGADPDRA